MFEIRYWRNETNDLYKESPDSFCLRHNSYLCVLISLYLQVHTSENSFWFWYIFIYILKPTWIAMAENVFGTSAIDIALGVEKSSDLLSERERLWQAAQEEKKKSKAHGTEPAEALGEWARAPPHTAREWRDLRAPRSPAGLPQPAAHKALEDGNDLLGDTVHPTAEGHARGGRPESKLERHRGHRHRHRRVAATIQRLLHRRRVRGVVQNGHVIFATQLAVFGPARPRGRGRVLVTAGDFPNIVWPSINNRYIVNTRTHTRPSTVCLYIIIKSYLGHFLVSRETTHLQQRRST